MGIDDGLDDGIDGEPDGWGHARWRLRDLRGRDRLFALGLLVLVLAPFAVALVRAFRDGWVPSADEANVATRSLDVFSRHPPLTGLPSTSGWYGGNVQANHPGPIEFYLLAVPLRVLGRSAGPLLTAATINGAFVLIALWAFFRRLGSTAMLWAGVLLLAVMWSAGTAVLTDTVSSNMTLYSVLCTAVLAWALVDGDLRLLPLAVLVASYAAQQHLAAGLVVLPLVVVATVALVIQIAKRIRRGDTAIGHATKQATIRWSIAAVAVAGLCWVSVVYDQITGHPGNLSQIVRFARDNSRPTVGIRSGLDQALHAVTPPTVMGRTDTTGSLFLSSLGPWRFTLGILVVGALGVLVWAARTRARAVARLAFVALVLFVAGFVNGSNVPASFEQSRVNLYRWSWAVGFVTWTALGMGIALLVARRAQRLAPRLAPRILPPALLVVAALIATAIVFVHGKDDHNQQRPAFALEKRIGAAVLARVDRTHPVVVVSEGFDASMTVRPYVVFRLVEAGVHVEVPSYLIDTYGHHRRYRPLRQSRTTAIVISSGKTKVPTAPGELISTQFFSPERTALLDDLSAAAFGTTVTFAPGARELLDREFRGLQRLYVDSLFRQLPTDPRPALEQPAFLKLVARGIIRTPAFDPSKVRRLLALPPERTAVAGDEQVQVRLLDPGQVQSPAFAKVLADAFRLR
ncbi:MAG: hypothetical protein QOH10_1098 [Actinomycetota bacterium]|nr:hypothetical protein [Actinomycetota bacterium]